MTIYRKLVRDKIPRIIQDNGDEPVIRELTTNEFARALRTKLSEETGEFIESGAPEELADILEVIYSLAELAGHTPESLEQLRSKKAAERGGFNDRIELVEIRETAYANRENSST